MLNTQKPGSPFVFAAVLLSGIALPLSEANALTRFTWSGFEWQARDTGGAEAGPRSNVFDPDNVTIENGNLILTLRELPDGTVTAAEVFTTSAVGYGRYRWEVSSINAVSAIPEAVLGLFVYSSDRKELDFEAAHFAGPDGDNGWHTIQGVDSQSFSFSGSAWDRSEHILEYHRNNASWTSRALNTTQNISVVTPFTRTPRPDGRMKIHMNLWSLLGSTGEIQLPPGGLRVTIRSVSYARTTS